MIIRNCTEWTIRNGRILVFIKNLVFGKAVVTLNNVYRPLVLLHFYYCMNKFSFISYSLSIIYMFTVRYDHSSLSFTYTCIHKPVKNWYINWWIISFSFAALFCPRWQLSAHSSINTSNIIFGTVAMVTCDEGFIIQDDHYDAVQAEIKCVSDGKQYPTAVWSSDTLTCGRKSDVSMLIRMCT